MSLPTTLTLILGLVGQAAAGGPQDKAPGGAHDTAAKRLDFMKASLKVHSVHPAKDPEAAYKLQGDPVLRFTNPVGTVQDGAIFLWTGADSRPEVAVQIFLHNDGSWIQEFSSLSTVQNAADDIWRTTRGIQFKPISGAPKPADTAEQRLRQIRELTARFSPEQRRQKVWEKLRILAKPLARYGKPGTPLIDGVLLGCVLTTDPEIYMMIEARETSSGQEWRYAFASSSIAPLRVLLNNEEVWKVPYRPAGVNNRALYYVWLFTREP